MGKQASRLSLFQPLTYILIISDLRVWLWAPFSSAQVVVFFLSIQKRPGYDCRKLYPMTRWVRQIRCLQMRLIRWNIMSEYLRRFQYQHLCPRHSWFFTNRRQTFPSVVSAFPNMATIQRHAANHVQNGLYINKTSNTVIIFTTGT